MTVLPNKSKSKQLLIAIGESLLWKWLIVWFIKSVRERQVLTWNEIKICVAIFQKKAKLFGFCLNKTNTFHLFQILEVAPKTVESVPVGTRLCAYWSQQYRCLYPGRAIESESSDDGETPNDSVSVEFDDGDSGRIRLQNIRFLLSDYPIVGKWDWIKYQIHAVISFASIHLSFIKNKGRKFSDQIILDDEEISPFFNFLLYIQ